MNTVYYLWCCIGCCFLSWLPCQGAGEKKKEEKVGVIFKEAELRRSRENGHWGDELKWQCRAVLVVREPWGFGDQSFLESQSLGIWDANGTELSSVEFHLGWLNGRHEKGMCFAEIEGTASKLPPSGCSWFRMKGSLRIPLVRLLESPVYELPLKQGASSFIPLPGSEEMNGGNMDDVVELNDFPMGTLYVERCEWEEESEEKQLVLKIGLDTNNLFCLEKFQILDEKGKVLDYESPGSSSVDEESKSWTANFTFSPPEKMDVNRCRIRLIYRAELKYVSFPVDARFGIGGEIREEPEKRKEKRDG